MRDNLLGEIQALEKRLAMFADDEVVAPVEDTLDEEIAALEDELEEDEVLELSPEEDDEDLEGEIDVMLSRLSQDQDAEIAQETEAIVKEDDADIEKATRRSASEKEGIARALLSLAQELTQEGAPEVVKPEEDMTQDLDEVEKVTGEEPAEGTDSGENGDVLPVAKKADDADYIQASQLQEASRRLDRVANALQSRGGKWVKIARQVDVLANTIDERRKVLASRVAQRLAAR